MKWWEYFMPWRWGRTIYYHNPNEVDINDYIQDHSAYVRYTFWRACAHLETKGYCLEHKHRIETFTFVKGTIKRPKGWAFMSAGMPVGGTCGLVEIKISVVPDTGALNPHGMEDMSHEWGHALLDGANIYKGNTDKQHEILHSVGL